MKPGERKGGEGREKENGGEEVQSSTTCF